MININLQGVKDSYLNWHYYMNQYIENFFSKNKTKKHWRPFLATGEHNPPFKDLSYTVFNSTGFFFLCYQGNIIIPTEREEEAKLLFFGMSVALTECNLSDIRHSIDDISTRAPFPPDASYQVQEHHCRTTRDESKPTRHSDKSTSRIFQVLPQPDTFTKLQSLP